jgi:hypothetical protein
MNHFMEMSRFSKAVQGTYHSMRSGHSYMRAIPSSAFQKNLSTLEKVIGEEE